MRQPNNQKQLKKQTNRMMTHAKVSQHVKLLTVASVVHHQRNSMNGRTQINQLNFYFKLFKLNIKNTHTKQFIFKGN